MARSRFTQRRVAVVGSCAVLSAAGAVAALASASPAASVPAPVVAAPVKVQGALTEPSNYAVFGQKAATESVPRLPADVNPITVRAITVPAGLPGGTRAWAAYGTHGPCIFIQFTSDAPVNGSCSGTGTQAPEVIVGQVPVANDKSGVQPGHVVTAGLAPNGVKNAVVTRVDGTKSAVPVDDNAYIADTAQPVADVELGVTTTTGATQ